jgi:hypothetical protein
VFEYSFSSARSRLDKEFVILDWLGKGAFGDVLKVKQIFLYQQFSVKLFELGMKT